MTETVTSRSDQTMAKPRRGGKREQLVAAAMELLHRQGIERTTLAEIAAAAEVPLGNMYYYFKKKDDIIAAVIESHAEQVTGLLAHLDATYDDPRRRLSAFVHELTSSDLVTEFGCPLGSLCAELDKRAERPVPSASQLMLLPLEWAERQFRALGRDDAHDLAVDLIAAYEGTALLANTLRDAAVLSRAGRRLEGWLSSL